MDAKIIIALLIAINCYSSCGAALRRTPKVYNALITTDENLTSSRAYPVIQPTIHQSGIAHYPFGPYNPYGYGYYSPPQVRFGQPLVPGFAPSGSQLPEPLPESHFPPQLMSQPPPNFEPEIMPDYSQQPPSESTQDTAVNAAPQAPSELPAEAQQPVKPPTALPPAQAPNYIPPLTDNGPEQMPNEKLPIPLNEYGLPPALIPLQQYPHRQVNAQNLSPYSFSQYPLINDPITGLREQYLPPYDYYPSHHSAFAVSKKPVPQTPSSATLSPPTTPTQESSTSGEPEASNSTPYINSPPTQQSDFESIKNASKSKNSAVPDVPPPPIPTRTKSQQS